VDCEQQQQCINTVEKYKEQQQQRISTVEKDKKRALQAKSVYDCLSSTTQSLPWSK
jgi:lysozyme family protein